MSNKNGKIPKYINKNKNLDSIIKKLNQGSDSDNKKDLNISDLSTITDSTVSKVKNNETIVKLFPDIELSIQITVSSILSPNDMLAESVIYSTKDYTIPPDIRAILLSEINKHLSTNYNFEDNLHDILRESLFTKGADILAVIPDAVVQDIADNNNKPSLESFLKDPPKSILGILGEENSKSGNISTEEYGNMTSFNNNEITESSLNINITDNLSVLTISDKILNNINKDISDRIHGNVSTEDASDQENLLNKFFNTKEGVTKKNVEVLDIDENDDDTTNTNKPLTMKLPVESVIPVHVTGDPSKHLGYFCMLDEKGNPITSDTAWKETQKLDPEKKITGYKKASIMEILKKADDSLNKYTGETPKFKDMEDVYSKILNNKILNRLRSGTYGDLASITNDSNDIHRIMFSRALSGKETKMLYIPGELVSYITFKHRENGTGESLIETIAVLSSIRAILMFARIMGSVKSSIPTTEVEVTLDENDADPKKTKEVIMAEMIKSRQADLPIGANGVKTFVDWVRKAGVKFNFSHPELPNMEIKTSTVEGNALRPDDDLELMIRKQMLMAMSIPPKAVEDDYDSDFATTIVTSNLLFTKRNLQRQKMFTKMLTERAIKLIKNDNNIKNVISEIIKKNLSKVYRNVRRIKSQQKKDGSISDINIKDETAVTFLTNKFIDSLELSLPTAEETRDTVMKDSFDSYKDSVKDYMEIFFSDDALPDELTGELSDKMDDFKNAMENGLLRKWMADNNYLPDISKMFTKDFDGKPMIDIFEEYNHYLSSLKDAVKPFLTDNNKLKKEIDKTLNKIGETKDDDDNGSDDNNGDGNDDTNANNTADTGKGDTGGATDDKADDTSSVDDTGSDDADSLGGDNIGDNSNI